MQSYNTNYRNLHIAVQSELENENIAHTETAQREDEEVRLSPIQIQQEYFENLPDCDWIKYEKCNRSHLLQNVAFALFGGPSVEGDLLNTGQNQEIQLEGYTSRQKEQVIKIYDKLCEQSKYSQNDEDIVMSILLIVCAKPKPLKFYQIEPVSYWWDLHQRSDIDIWCTAVFMVRQCIPTTVNAKGCRVYVDDQARVYQNWNSYLTNNTLPKCVAIVPENGEYKGTIIQGEEAFAVKLTVAPSPALGIKAKVLSSVDTVSTIASLGAVGVLGVAAFTPVGPAVLIGATVATVASGIYGLVRSSIHLHDRKTHEQSISPTDSEARGSWINIAASGVGLTASAAATMLSRSAAAGSNLTKTGQALTISVEVLRRANIITGGVGVANSLLSIILKYHKHGEKPTKLELFQFSAATLFFCHAVVSNRTAQNIVEDAQANTINEYRATLRSNRHRKIFDKITAESRRVQGMIQGNAEVIQGIKTISNKDQFFADVLRINKDVNQHKLRISMTADGQVNLNSQFKYNPSDLSSMGKDVRSELFSSLGPANVTTRNVATKVLPSTSIGQYSSPDQEDGILVGIHPGEVIRIGVYLIRVSTSGAESIAKILEDVSREVYANIMTISLNILSKLVPQEIARLKLLSPEQDLLVQIVEFVFNYLRHKRPLGEPCRNNDDGIVLVLKEFFQDGVVRKDTVLCLKDRLVFWVDHNINERNRLYPQKKPIICSCCQGIRFA